MTNYFENSKRACLSIIDKQKKHLQANFLMTKNQASMFTDDKSQQEEQANLVYNKKQWAYLNQLYNHIKHFKGV